MQNNLTAFIFARGGSKGVKNKNIREVAGKPLIAHAICTALESTCIAKVVVSTDSEKIANTAATWGAEILGRPASLAGDKAPEIEAWRHAIRCYEKELVSQDNVFISIPATSPLKNTEDINAAIEKYHANDFDLVLGVSPAKTNPQLTLVTLESEKIQLLGSGQGIYRRQDVIPMFNIIGGVYVSNSDYLMSAESIVNDNTGYILIPEERALDIDSEFDLHLADLLLTHPFIS